MYKKIGTIKSEQKKTGHKSGLKTDLNCPVFDFMWGAVTESPATFGFQVRGRADPSSELTRFFSEVQQPGVHRAPAVQPEVTEPWRSCVGQIRLC